MVLYDGPDPETVGCGFNSFREIEEVNELIAGLRRTDLSPSQVEKNRDRFCFVLSQYQDQRQLLDPHLEQMLRPLLAIIRGEASTEAMRHNAFKYLFIITSVKTYKKIVAYLPHEVTDLLPVLRMLEKQDPNDVETWETRYVLLVWLSIISKIPFPLSRLETSEDVPADQSIVVRIMNICKLFCLSKDACAVAAVFLIANFLTRSDVKELYMEEMIMWSLQCVENDPLRHGPLAVLAAILKHSAREDVTHWSRMLHEKLHNLQLGKSSAVLVRKFSIKIAQRIGVVFLGTKPASWRYMRTKRHVCLEPSNPKYFGCSPTKDNEEIQPGLESIVEDLIEQHMQGLRDKAITIRWSAAKGIAKITARLPMHMAEQVVGYILQLCTVQESDYAWHGGCLALAEFGRRGLFAPSQISDVMPVIMEALVFDEQRAYGTISPLIRDSACYALWSVSRIYDPEVLKPHMKEIAATLIKITCFDREVNCRRAASAAFQELVGRHEDVPHGIEIVTIADYYEVGVRNNAYLRISVEIAHHSDYTKPLIHYLMTEKVSHWDAAIRELAAKALHQLTKLDTSYVRHTVIPHLLDRLSVVELYDTHGTILALAEVLQALHKCCNVPMEDIVRRSNGDKDFGDFKGLVSRCRCRGQFKGLGGELIRQACTALIKTCANANFAPDDMDLIHDWQSFLEECLSHEVSAVRVKAAEAHADFFQHYYLEQRDQRRVIVERYLENLRSNSQTVRIGFAQAIAHFPLDVMGQFGQGIIRSLILCSKVTEATLNWAESRKVALHSLTKVCLALGPSTDEWREFMPDIYDCYLLALKEYTIDSRGDIGAWVREAALTGLHVVTNMMSQAGLQDRLDERLMTEIIGGVAQQAVERIDGIRAHAGTIFGALIHADPPLSNIPHLEELRSIFPATDCKERIEWRMESQTFPRFVEMLSFPPYTMYLLRGLIFSVGGISESLVKHSSVSLFSYLQEIDEEGLLKFCCDVLSVFEESHKKERMVTSILAFLDRLLSSGCVQSVLDKQENGVAERMLALLKQEIKNTSNTKLLISSINVFCQFLQVRGPVSRKAFCQLSIFLCHKYKCLRKVAATRTYEALTLYGEDMDVPEEDLSSILERLNSTDWEQAVSELRPVRNQLCALMKVPAPVLQSKAGV